jgi:hypothetical protein
MIPPDRKGSENPAHGDRRIQHRLAAHFADIRAGAENVVATGDYDCPDNRFARQIVQQARHLLAHSSIERIFLFRPMQANRRNRPILSLV